MSDRNDSMFNRRDVLAGLAGFGAIALASGVRGPCAPVRRSAKTLGDLAAALLAADKILDY